MARIDTFSTTLHRAREAGPSDQVPYEGRITADYFPFFRLSFLTPIPSLKVMFEHLQAQL